MELVEIIRVDSRYSKLGEVLDSIKDRACTDFDNEFNEKNIAQA